MYVPSKFTRKQGLVETWVHMSTHYTWVHMMIVAFSSCLSFNSCVQQRKFDSLFWQSWETSTLSGENGRAGLLLPQLHDRISPHDRTKMSPHDRLPFHEQHYTTWQNLNAPTWQKFSPQVTVMANNWVFRKYHENTGYMIFVKCIVISSSISPPK